MTSLNVVLLSSAAALISMGANTIATNLVAGVVQIAVGVGLVLIYEKTPASR